MLLEPAWKLLNVNLSIYTEVFAYGAELEERKRLRRCDSDIDALLPEPVLGMNLCLIELLTTLISKGSVRPVVEQALVPIITSVASYMILSEEEEREQLNDLS